MTHGISSLENSSSTTSEDDEEQQVPIVVSSSRPSAFGRIRTLNNLKAIEWSFIGVSYVSILVGIGFTVYRMSTLPMDSDQFVFTLLVMVNLGFAVYYLLHGVFLEQPFEVLMYIFTTFVLGGLLILNFTTEETGADEVRLIRFIVTMILSVPNCLIGCSLGWEYWTSGALIFKTVGGDMQLQKMCRIYFFGLSLLVFDAQANITCLILVMEKGLSGMQPDEIVIFVSGVIFTVLWFVIGYNGMRSENIRVTWLFAVSCIVQPLYVLYLFVKGFQLTDRPYSLRTKSTFLAGMLLLLTHFTLLATVPVIGSNYGKGLKEAIYEQNSHGMGRINESDDAENGPLIRPGTSRQDKYGSIQTPK